MQSLTELDSDALKLARQSADTLMKFKAYLPPGGLLVMLTSKLRDDVGDALEIERDPLPSRRRERGSLDEMTTAELGAVRGAVMILLQDRFKAVMDDPALPTLLDQYQDMLDVQRAERHRLRAEVAPADARPS